MSREHARAQPPAASRRYGGEAEELCCFCIFMPYYALPALVLGLGLALVSCSSGSRVAVWFVLVGLGWRCGGFLAIWSSGIGIAMWVPVPMSYAM
jgi:hypothetical protein